MSRHCPHCNAYPHATFRDGELQRLVTRHTDRCFPREDPIDPAGYLPVYDPAKRADHGTARKLTAKPSRNDRQIGEAMVGKTNRARTPDGRPRRR